MPFETLQDPSLKPGTAEQGTVAQNAEEEEREIVAEQIANEVRGVVEAKGREKEEAVKRIASRFHLALNMLEKNYAKGVIADEKALDRRLERVQREFEEETTALGTVLNEAYAKADADGDSEVLSAIRFAYDAFFKGFTVPGQNFQLPENQALREKVETAIAERRARIARRKEAIQLLAAAGVEVPEGKLVLVEGDCPVAQRAEERDGTPVVSRSFKLMGNAGAIKRDMKAGGPVGAVYGVQSLPESVTEYPASGTNGQPLWQERYFHTFDRTGSNGTPELFAKLKLEGFRPNELPQRIERLSVEKKER